MRKTVKLRNHVLVLINPLKGPLQGATTPGHSGPGGDGNEGVFHIPQGSSITRTSPSDCLESYPRLSLRGLAPLQRSSRCILQLQPSGQKLKRLINYQKKDPNGQDHRTKTSQ